MAQNKAERSQIMNMVLELLIQSSNSKYSFIYEVKNFRMQNPVHKRNFYFAMELSMYLFDKTNIVTSAITWSIVRNIW